MSMILVGKQKISHTKTKVSDEVMVSCPGCKAFETVWFNNGQLNENRKFTQYGTHIYHNCGSNSPCLLYMTT